MSAQATTPAASTLRRDLAFQFRKEYRVVWFALAALLIVCAISAQTIFKAASVEFITGLAGVLAVASAGQLLVIISGGIDLSVPAVMTLAGAIVVKHTQGADDRLLAAILIGLAAAAVVGLINGLLVTFARLNAFIVTLAMNGVVAGAIVLWATTTWSASGNAPRALVRFVHKDVVSVSIVAVVGLGVLILTALVLRNTTVGRSFVAMGTNRVAAEIIGVRVRLYQVGGYVVAAMLYMGAGILLSGIVQAPNTTIGDPYQLMTIVAVALGGASLAGGPGSVIGTGAGCLFVALLNQYLDIKDFGSGVQPLASGIVLVLAVAMVTAGSRGRLGLMRLRSRPRHRQQARHGASGADG